jgi:hypothetical protein
MSRRILVGPAALAIVLSLVGIALAAARGTSRPAPSAGAASSAMCGSLTRAPRYRHVVVIFMENASYSTIQSSTSTPYIHSLERACALGTNCHNITHPSLPEYMAATYGGSLAELTPFLPDCTPSLVCQSGSNNIFHQLNAAGRVWKGYAESMPSNCDKANAGFYAPRHNPAVYYTDLRNCSSRDVPLGTTSNSPLLRNFSSEKTAPAFAWITPNLCHDMHGISGCPANLLQAGDNWLRTWIPKITSTSVYKKHDKVILLTWDEGEGGQASSGENCATNTSDPSCRVVFIPIAPSVKPGKQVARLLNHWSLLKASEDLLGLPELDQAKTATSLLKAFNL